MSNRIKIVGVDPSLRSTGLAIGWLDIDTLQWEVEEVKLVKTEKSKLKMIRKSADDYDRCRILYEGLRETVEDAQLAFVEMPIGSQSSDAMKSYGAMCMLAATIDCPMIQVTPAAVKVQATGDKLAQKEEMIEWATNKWPDINWLRSGKRLIGANEHLADACGAINAGMKEGDFDAVVAMLRSSNTV
jgi:Holliday junction resolvasome RuvABC endonuclease subunit